LINGNIDINSQNITERVYNALVFKFDQSAAYILLGPQKKSSTNFISSLAA